MIYDKLAPYYDRFFNPLDSRMIAKWRAEALSLLPVNSKILEIGAGTGRNFEYYPAFKRGVATDISIEMLKLASARESSIEIVQADAEELPFADDSFDSAFATLVFCSIPRPEAAFREVIRTVSAGGTVVLLEHVRPHGLLGRFFDALNVLTVALIEDHFNRETAETARSCGLRVIERREKAAGAVNLLVCQVVK